MESRNKSELNSEKTKTQNMARALYETGYDQQYVMNAIQSKGFSDNEAVELNFMAYQEVHNRRRNKFIGYLIALGIFSISFFLIGRYYDFQDFDKIPEMTDEAKKIVRDMDIAIPAPGPPKQNFDNNVRLIISSGILFISFLGVLARFLFKVLPQYKSIPRPIEKPETLRRIPTNRRR